MLFFLKKSKYLVFAFLLVSAIVFIGGCQSSSTTNSDQPETVLTNFLDSLIEMDAQKAASFAVDSRFSDKEEQLKFYEEGFQQTKYLGYEIGDIKKSGDEKVYIDAALICDEFGINRESSHTFRLILVDGQWKVAFPSDESIEHLFQGGGEGTITFGEPEMNNQKSLNTGDKDWMEVSLNMADLEKVQEHVNQGHKVGLLDPIQVAREFLEDELEIKGGGEAVLNDSAGEEKIVRINFEEDKSIEVRLIQPTDKGRPGIWAVNAYRYL